MYGYSVQTRMDREGGHTSFECASAFPSHGQTLGLKRAAHGIPIVTQQKQTRWLEIQAAPNIMSRPRELEQIGEEVKLLNKGYLIPCFSSKEWVLLEKCSGKFSKRDVVSAEGHPSVLGTDY